MDSVLFGIPQAAAQPHAAVPPLPFPNYDAVLRDSLDRFLADSQQGSPDISAFRAVFSRFLQSTPDPPFEILWFYSAVTYHDAAPSKTTTSDKLTAVRDLLQLFAACSAACRSPKCVALLAPALAELHKCATSAPAKSRKEIEGLVEGVVSYISICSSKNSDRRKDGQSTRLLPRFLDLVRVWTSRRPGGGDGLEEMFPLVGVEVREGMRERGCAVEYLAGVVTAEAFLMRLCLKVRAGGASRLEAQKELRVWAVSSVSVFRNCAFFEILMLLLLGPTLPVTSLLNSEDEKLVRDILYDVVILVDYSFLSSGIGEEQSYGYMKNLALTRLIVTHEAIRIARAKGDHGKAITYTNAFSTSGLPNGVLRLVANQIDTERVNRPKTTTPEAFLKWLVDLEEQGIRLFEDNMSNLRSKLIFDELKDVSVNSMFNSDSQKTDAELFFLDKQGEVAEEGGKDEEMEPVDEAFMAAARSMKSASNGRKRKEWQSEGESQVKFVKYRIHDSSIKEYFLPSAGNGMSSGSEVDNPSSDEEMEETEH